ncbi:hypothetical protein [Haloquadratum walsbyi]|jgi:transposase-like protein|uniref:Small CPxCG-related zinc finger protein n=1 Tax=Haloquadratum walsbyi (strain DSM 16854 / JCM 12705 / C23) TaxID=768065 RepID=G0LL79_HALWC|nr:hypothetical protein [Haloquadratum walsbyi]CCC40519.1 small CPxCG-related zinc finger protein [Haloquadratum walsbyi C23]
MVRCKNCETSFEHADEVSEDEVDKIETTDDNRPRIQIGTNKHAVWRCPDCGSVLGVR